MPDIFGWFKHWEGIDLKPKGIAKKFVAPAAVAGLVSYGAITISDDMSNFAVEGEKLGLLQEGSCGLGCKTKAWVNRHPAIAGGLAGCAAGSFVPVVGTIVGCATGATVGYTIGSDERAGRAEERMLEGGKEL